MDDARFEAMLAAAITRYAADDPEVVDALATARGIVTRHPRGGMRGPRGALVRWPSVGGRAALVLAALVALALAAGSVAGALLSSPAPGLGSFEPTGPLLEGREQATATLLHDGRVLVVGGWESGARRVGRGVGPGHRAVRRGGVLGHPRWGHTATLLDDGRVLVAGGIGWGAEGSPASSSTPSCGTRTPRPSPGSAAPPAATSRAWRGCCPTAASSWPGGRFSAPACRRRPRSGTRAAMAFVRAGLPGSDPCASRPPSS